MVLCPHQHSIGYMSDGFYRSKDPTNSQSTKGKKLQRKTTQTTQRKYKIHTCIHIQHNRQIKDTRISTANPLVYNNMGWLGDGSHRGQGCQAWTAVGLLPRYPQQVAVTWWQNSHSTNAGRVYTLVIYIGHRDFGLHICVQCRLAAFTDWKSRGLCGPQIIKFTASKN